MAFLVLRSLKRGHALPTLLLLGSFANACGRSTKFSLKDTENRQFTAKFDGTELRVSAVGPEKPGVPYEVRRTGHLVALCAPSTTDTKPAVTSCRALVCQADTDCPPAHGLSQGTCINGLCIEPSLPVAVDDAIMLCLAGTGAEYGSPLQVERFALGLNCGHPCRVPSPCRQP